MSSNDQSPSVSIAVNGASYTILPERLPRIPEEQMSDQQRKVTADLAATRGSLRGPFRATMRCPELMDHMQKLGAHIRYKCGLDVKINRLASLMVARHWTNQYEWAASVPYAHELEISPDIIDAIRDGRRPRAMSDDQEVLYEFVTELLANKSVCDQTYGMAVNLFGEQGVVELLSVVGYYSMNAIIMNVSRTPAPDGDPLPLAAMPRMLRSNK